MNLILKKDVKSSFEKQWLTIYVPAIILYGQRSRKKSVLTLIKNMNKLGKQSNIVQYIILQCCALIRICIIL